MFYEGRSQTLLVSASQIPDPCMHTICTATTKEGRMVKEWPDTTEGFQARQRQSSKQVEEQPGRRD